MAEVIHKVNITAEARFDYDCLFDNRKQEPWGEILARFGGDRAKAFSYYDKYDKPSGLFDTPTLKRELEEYITYRAAANRIPRWGYFRVDYEDDASGERLKLFFYKGEQIGCMQIWNLAGLCVSADWTQELEDDGRIRNWLKEKVEDVPDYEDWAVCDRVRQILNNTEKTKWENVLKEVLNVFECERDKEVATQLAILQSQFFTFGCRRAIQKSKRDRACNGGIAGTRR